MVMYRLKKAVAPLLLALLSNSECARAQKCTGGRSSFTTPTLGNCMENWKRNNEYEYPNDFEGILNDMTVYTCPTSEKRVIVSNGIPDHTVKQGNNNAPCEINWAILLPLNPEKSDDLEEIPSKGLIAIATNGVPAYGAKEVDDMNAVEPNGDIVDAQYWYGHATKGNIWHFHNPYMGKDEADSDTLLGWALDGFPIYGPFEIGSSNLDSLDNCNGRDVNGSYQYHVRHVDDVDENKDYCNGDDDPETNWNYILGCYHGTTDGTSVEDSTTFSLPTDCIIEGSPTSAPITGVTATPTAPPVDLPPSVVDTRPNIIVMQPDDMAFFDAWSPPPNNPKTPNQKNNFPETNGLPHMDSLRSNGVQMMEAYAASPSCGTSRFSTITGKYPSRAASSRDKGVEGIVRVTIPSTKLKDVGDAKDCTENNLAAALKDAGYRTGMVGKWHLSKFDGNTYDYDAAVETVQACGFDFVDALYIENMESNEDDFDNYNDGTFSHNMEFVTYEAINFINDNDGTKPFFLYFNPTVPHKSQSVLTALTKFTCRMTPREDEESDFMIKGMTEEFGGCEEYRANVIERADEDADLGSIWLDDSVGALLQALSDNDILDNTLFIFQMDHGVETKMALYENGIRIVQFVQYPDMISPGTQYDAPVSTIDIAATLLDFAEVETLPYEMDGKSWRSNIENMGSRNLSDNSRCLFFENEDDRAVRCGCDKLLTIDAQDAATSTTYSIGSKKDLSADLLNLFDLCGGTDEYITDATDNQEEKTLNLVDTSPTVTEKMEALMNCHLERTDYSAATDDFTSCELNPSTSHPTTSAPTTGSSPAPTTPPTTLSPTTPPTTLAPTTPPTTLAPTMSPNVAETKTPTMKPTDECTEKKFVKWFLKLHKKKGTPILKTCKYLAGLSWKKKKEICESKVDYEGNYGPPQDHCQKSCNSCRPCYENVNSKFVFKLKTNKLILKTCDWLSGKTTKSKKKVCKKDIESGGYGTPSVLCPVTCSVGKCAK